MKIKCLDRNREVIFIVQWLVYMFPYNSCGKQTYLLLHEIKCFQGAHLVQRCLQKWLIWYTCTRTCQRNDIWPVASLSVKWMAVPQLSMVQACWCWIYFRDVFHLSKELMNRVFRLEFELIALLCVIATVFDSELLFHSMLTE